MEAVSLKIDLISNEEKLRAIGDLLDDIRKQTGRDDPSYLAMKAVARDLKSRLELPRSNTLGEIERALERTSRSRTALGYDEGQLQQVAYTVMKHWPVIRQALEHFGEVSAE